MTFEECLRIKTEDPVTRILVYTNTSEGCTELTIVYKDTECALRYSSDGLLASTVDEFMPHLNPLTRRLEYWITICYPLERSVKEGD